MRFLVQPSPDALARARPPVRAFLAFGAVALAALAAQRGLAGGFSPAGVELHYLGDPAFPGEGLPVAALWEELHAGAFLYGMIVLMAGSLLAICPVSAALRRGLFGAALASTLADLAAPFAVVALGGGGGLRVATTAAALASLLACVAVAFVTFGQPVPPPAPFGRRADA